MTVPPVPAVYLAFWLCFPTFLRFFPPDFLLKDARFRWRNLLSVWDDFLNDFLDDVRRPPVCPPKERLEWFPNKVAFADPDRPARQRMMQSTAEDEHHRLDRRFSNGHKKLQMKINWLKGISPIRIRNTRKQWKRTPLPTGYLDCFLSRVGACRACLTKRPAVLTMFASHSGLTMSF